MGQDTTETQDITQEELDEIERLDREATPGPWVHIGVGEIASDLGVLIGKMHARPNTQLVTVLRTLLPRLARAYRALRVQRDALETDFANGHQAIEDLNQALDRSRAKLKDEYTRGRREAIEEAAEWIRRSSFEEVTKTANVQISAQQVGMRNLFDFASIMFAKAIERHETEISK